MPRFAQSTENGQVFDDPEVRFTTHPFGVPRNAVIEIPSSDGPPPAPGSRLRAARTLRRRSSGSADALNASSSLRKCARRLRHALPCALHYESALHIFAW